MLRRVRRTAAVLTPVLLLVPALTSCGSDSHASGHSSTGKVDGVSLAGDVGKELKATWHKKLAPPKSTSITTLVKGEGSKVADGDTASTYLWVGDGTTKKTAYSDYTNGSPESIPISSKLSTLFGKLFEHATYGSRVAAVTTAKDLLGSSSGNPQLGIGAKDSLVVVADIVKKQPVSPTPSDSKAHDAAPSKLPQVTLGKGKPSGLGWKGISEPSASTPVQRAVLKKGTGPKVKPTDTVTVNYLGETYKATSPFDESYTKKPLTQPLSSLIPGWKIGLSGVPVGSRVLLQIPPAFAYGAQGSGSQIPGNSTLWFVIDVVKASAK